MRIKQTPDPTISQLFSDTVSWTIQVTIISTIEGSSASSVSDSVCLQLDRIGPTTPKLSHENSEAEILIMLGLDWRLNPWLDIILLYIQKKPSFFCSRKWVVSRVLIRRRMNSLILGNKSMILSKPIQLLLTFPDCLLVSGFIFIDWDVKLIASYHCCTICCTM